MSFPIDIQTDKTKGKLAPQKTVLQEDVLRTILSSNNQNIVFDMTGYASFSMTIDNGFQSPNSKFSIQGSNDLVQWLDFPVKTISTGVADIVGYTINTNNNRSVLVASNRVFKYVKVYSNSLFVNHRVTIVRSQNSIINTNRTLQDLPDSYWKYISPIGGVTTSPITLVAGAGLPVKNLLKSIQLTNNGTAFVEASILDGAAGAALWRQVIPINGILLLIFEIGSTQ